MANARNQSLDRFIPARNNKQMEVASFLLSRKPDGEEAASSARRNTQKALSVALNNFDIEKAKILNLGGKPYGGFYNNFEVGCNKVPTSASMRKRLRHISSVPETVLDAADLRDDFNLNLMDWGKQNMLAVAADHCVYLWDVKLEETMLLKMMEEENSYVSSVSWTKDGKFLAIGTSECNVELWDVGAQKCLRVMSGHRARVSSLNWNSRLLSSGSKSGLIHQHDVRLTNHHLTTLRGHTQEVCGLTWSPSGSYLASSGDDSLVNIWPSSQDRSQRPVHTFRKHQGAVKALAWCPWRPGILASGGAEDQHICVWDVKSGSFVTSLDTHSQVSSLMFAPNYKELVSGHGLTPDTISIWDYPSLNQVAKIKGHKGRVLNMSLSPDGSVLASVGSDKTVQLWNCFEREAIKPMPLRSSIFTQLIR